MKRGFQKYIDDAHGESNEMIVSLTHCVEIYPEHVDDKRCRSLIQVYDVASRQLFRLRQAWKRYHEESA